MTILLAVFLWWLIGTVGFVFWWTNEHDFQVSEIPVAACAGLVLGPFTWGVGWFIHGDAPAKAETVLIRQRK